ncbi:hypothetical protein CKAH01_10211 [Colletotrichum kahawae]|uniref:DUF7791 domain-containing protein n=1 Tax=Colletotrichum kahawae TaxID=34407 RepID=A0AAD9XYW7_COLKA|nr:hypothetical protein CKAH01_10211 [Colletotrichum kahawae]
MKYLCRHPRTTELLRKWASGRMVPKLIVAAHFFFERGITIQKSRDGMLKSIIYQSRFVANIRSTFESLLSNFNDELSICLFIDGLDEYRIVEKLHEYTAQDLDLIYDGPNEDDLWGRSDFITKGYRELISMLQTGQHRQGIKICLSSRELNTFEARFRELPRLKVHDHTKEDIRCYSKSRFRSEAPGLPPPEALSMVDSIVEMSLGVFLWVRLVCDLIVDGAANKDSPSDLAKRLRSLPRELGGEDGLYMRMVNTIPLEYRIQSARLFRLTLSANNPLRITTLFLASEGHLFISTTQKRTEKSHTAELLAVKDQMNPIFERYTEGPNILEKLVPQLKSRTMGLLELNGTVDFMHQTAKQFFTRHQDTIFMEVLRSTTDEVFEPNIALLSGIIRDLKRYPDILSKYHDYPYPAIDENDFYTISDALHYARAIERQDFCCAQAIGSLARQEQSCVLKASPFLPMRFKQV